MNKKLFILLIFFTAIYAQNQIKLIDFKNVYEETFNMMVKTDDFSLKSQNAALSASIMLEKSEKVAKKARKQAKKAKEAFLQAQDAFNKASLESIEAKKILKKYEEDRWEDDFVDEAEAALENFDEAELNYQIQSDAYKKAQQQLEDAQEQLNEAKNNFKIAQQVTRFYKNIYDQFSYLYLRDPIDQDLFGQYEKIIADLKAFQEKTGNVEEKVQEADNKKD